MATTEAEYLAQWEEMPQGTDRRPPLHRLTGIEMVSLTPTTILSMQLSDDERGQVEGTIHGGILATFADVTAAVALWNSFDVESEAPVTTDLHVRVYRQPEAGPLTTELPLCTEAVGSSVLNALLQTARRESLLAQQPRRWSCHWHSELGRRMSTPRLEGFDHIKAIPDSVGGGL